MAAKRTREHTTTRWVSRPAVPDPHGLLVCIACSLTLVLGACTAHAPPASAASEATAEPASEPTERDATPPSNDDASFGTVWPSVLERAREGRRVRLTDPSCDAEGSPPDTCGVYVRALEDLAQDEAAAPVGLLLCPRGAYVPASGTSAPWSAEAVTAFPTEARLEEWLRANASQGRIIVAVDADVPWARVHDTVQATARAGYAVIALASTDACTRFAPDPSRGRSVRGSIPAATVFAWVEQRQREVVSCGTSLPGATESLGTLTVRFIIAPDGTVSGAAVVGRTFVTGLVEIEECALGRILRWRFPTRSGGVTSVDYTFTF